MTYEIRDTSSVLLSTDNLLVAASELLAIRRTNKSARLFSVMRHRGDATTTIEVAV